MAIELSPMVSYNLKTIARWSEVRALTSPVQPIVEFVGYCLPQAMPPPRRLRTSASLFVPGAGIHKLSLSFEVERAIPQVRLNPQAEIFVPRGSSRKFGFDPEAECFDPGAHLTHSDDIFVSTRVGPVDDLGHKVHQAIAETSAPCSSPYQTSSDPSTATSLTTLSSDNDDLDEESKSTEARGQSNDHEIGIVNLCEDISSDPGCQASGDTTCSADDIEYGRQRYHMFHDQEIHHFNWFGQAVMNRTSTPPAVSLTVVLTPPSARISDTENLRDQIILREAMKTVDPVVYYGGLSELKDLAGEAIREAATGRVSMYYTPFGTWKDDTYSEDEDRPLTDTLDETRYLEETTVVNGWLKNEGVPIRENFWADAEVAFTSAEALRKKAIDDRRNFGVGQTRLRSALMMVGDDCHEVFASTKEALPSDASGLISRSIKQDNKTKSPRPLYTSPEPELSSQPPASSDIEGLQEDKIPPVSSPGNKLAPLNIDLDAVFGKAPASWADLDDDEEVVTSSLLGFNAQLDDTKLIPAPLKLNKSAGPAKRETSPPRFKIRLSSTSKARFLPVSPVPMISKPSKGPASVATSESSSSCIGLEACTDEELEDEFAELYGPETENVEPLISKTTTYTREISQGNDVQQSQASVRTVDTIPGITFRGQGPSENLEDEEGNPKEDVGSEDDDIYGPTTSCPQKLEPITDFHLPTIALPLRLKPVQVPPVTFNLPIRTKTTQLQSSALKLSAETTIAGSSESTEEKGFKKTLLAAVECPASLVDETISSSGVSEMDKTAPVPTSREAEKPKDEFDDEERKGCPIHTEPKSPPSPLAAVSVAKKIRLSQQQSRIPRKVRPVGSACTQKAMPAFSLVPPAMASMVSSEPHILDQIDETDESLEEGIASAGATQQFSLQNEELGKIDIHINSDREAPIHDAEQNLEGKGRGSALPRSRFLESLTLLVESDSQSEPITPERSPVPSPYKRPAPDTPNGMRGKRVGLTLPSVSEDETSSDEESLGARAGIGAIFDDFQEHEVDSASLLSDDAILPLPMDEPNLQPSLTARSFAAQPRDVSTSESTTSSDDDVFFSAPSSLSTRNTTVTSVAESSSRASPSPSVVPRPAKRPVPTSELLEEPELPQRRKASWKRVQNKLQKKRQVSGECEKEHKRSLLKKFQNVISNNVKKLFR